MTLRARVSQLSKEDEAAILAQQALNNAKMVEAWVNEPDSKKATQKGLRQLIRTSCFNAGKRHENRLRMDDDTE